MGKLIYTNIASLDGYIADADGNFDWGVPDGEAHTFINDLESPVALHLYGRRLYEVMVAWEDLPLEGEPEPIQDFAHIWRATEKIVYSTTLDAVRSSKTRLETSFEAEAIHDLKAATDGDIEIGGPTLAAHALRASLVDEMRVFVTPVIVGGGTSFLPDGVTLPLTLLESRQFRNGMVYLRYAFRADDVQ